MFTGIVEEIGELSKIDRNGDSAVLTIKAKKVLEDTQIGDSIAVNGVCLTVINIGKDYFSADVMHETLNRSSLKEIDLKNHVNLERAMPADGRFGGHIVAGHIDGVGIIKNIVKDANAVIYTISADTSILKYIVEKGSIAIDGTSLTVTEVTDEYFSVAIIPHTIEVTVLASKKTGDKVNLETDIIGKYVEKLINFKNVKSETKSKITLEFLSENGF